jgi:hypothetical protein
VTNVCPAERPRYDDACACYELNLRSHDPGLAHGSAWDRMSNDDQDQVIATERQKQERRRAEALTNAARMYGRQGLFS